MTRTLPWQLWPGRHYPLSPIEEANFVADLETAVEHEARTLEPFSPERTKILERDWVTVMLGALRCGSSYPLMRELAPGIRAFKLLEAYRQLESLRAASEASWHAIVAEPTPLALREHGVSAGLLLPIPVYNLADHCSRLDQPGLERLVEATAARVAERTAQSRRLERELARTDIPSDVAVERGRALYDPYIPGLWSSTYFLPDRVGALVPVRVRDLLGERGN